MISQILAITRKELKAYFGSPMAAIFIGAFLLSVLFSFFWMETFFARNIADVRPLFRWMPLLMIFLTAALTMRQWSEEQKMGTLEVLLTLPVRLSSLVLGKFLAVLALVGLALALTLGLPLTVALLGNIDWGPVAGGYLGCLLMAAAYIAIGLFISARTDNQIIALILTVLTAGLFYLIGSPAITNFLGSTAGEVLRFFGTGSRFASIERGVLDLRDIAYYGFLTGLFLLLNVVSLESKRWSRGGHTAVYRRAILIGTGLIAANLLAAGIWLQTIHWARLDLTENRDYSLSETSRDLIANLEEPLTLRGYFSEKTHPLLAPLVPGIRDLMTEYAVASGGRIQVAFVDPKYDEEMEAEANQQFGIKPVPFQVDDRYEASVVSSYFNILIKYGDQYVTLGFDDLIEIQQRADGQLDVGLRNLEYDLSKSIKKVVYSFQSLAAVFANITKELQLTAIVTPGALPPSLAQLPASIRAVGETIALESGGKLQFSFIDPDNGQGPDRAAIDGGYGIQPMALSLFSDQSFYLYLFLAIGDQTERIYIDGDMGEAEIRREVEAALKRTSSGFLQTVGIWTPPTDSPTYQMYQPQPRTDQYRLIKEILRENYNLESINLGDGRIPGNIDVLLVVAPQDLTDLELLAVDQYLMRGGSVIAMTGSYLLDITPYSQSLAVKKTANGLQELLAHYGITVRETMVMDSRNEPFPVPVNRDLGGFTVQEIQLVDYPYFVDVRSDGMATESPMLRNLPAITLNWVSPLRIDPALTKNSKVTTLLHSSAHSWLNDSTDINPDFTSYPNMGFAVGNDTGPQPLAVSLQGALTSYFAGRPDPRSQPASSDPAGIEVESLDTEESSSPPKQDLPPEPIIRKSADSARLLVVGSSEFLHDTVFSISQSLGQDRYRNSLEFLQNTIDWSLEDEGLLTIRSRGSHARILEPLSRRAQSFWEWLNYAIALIALTAISMYGVLRQRKEVPLQITGNTP